MELALKPHSQNTAPLGGVLLTGGSAESWLRSIQALGLSLGQVTAYALPQPGGTNVWGCLLVCSTDGLQNKLGPHMLCQQVHQLLFVPPYTTLFPALTPTELDNLLLSRPHFFHPETGLIELLRPVDWSELLQTPTEKPVSVQRPALSGRVPGQIRAFQVQPAPPEQTLERLEQQAFPKSEILPNQPLTLPEKARLAFYRQLFGKPGLGGASALLLLMGQLRQWFGGQKTNWQQDWQLDQEQLEERNKKQLDRLLDMLQKNPNEALKYAIPLDQEGVSRGEPGGGLMGLDSLWLSFALFNNPGRSGKGRAIVLTDSSFDQLQQQYKQTARNLIEQGDYQKAAFVYLKLLKNPSMAAETLEQGKLYAEAAAVWLKHAKDKTKAAACYEKAGQYQTAIDLYVELGQHEKAGDLYAIINRPKESRQQYQIVADALVVQQQFLKAAQVYRHKLKDIAQSQGMLFRGWTANKDAFNCLTSYFECIHELSGPKTLISEISQIQDKHVDNKNREVFLQVIKHEFNRYPALAEPLRDIAYELIATHAVQYPGIVQQLIHFDRTNQQLTKDIIRYKTGHSETR